MNFLFVFRPFRPHLFGSMNTKSVWELVFFGLKYLISLSENWCRFYLLSFLKEFLFGMDGMSRTLTFL